jgi:prophage DNA circulation protein
MLNQIPLRRNALKPHAFASTPQTAVTASGNGMSQNMDGSATGTTACHDSTGKLLPGHTEWHARKRRLAALVEQLAGEYDARSPIAKQLLLIAAQHLDQAATTRSSTLRGRATRLAAKVLDRLQHKPERLPATLKEALDQ